MALQISDDDLSSTTTSVTFAQPRPAAESLLIPPVTSNNKIAVSSDDEESNHTTDSSLTLAGGAPKIVPGRTLDITPNAKPLDISPPSQPRQQLRLTPEMKPPSAVAAAAAAGGSGAALLDNISADSSSSASSFQMAVAKAGGGGPGGILIDNLSPRSSAPSFELAGAGFNAVTRVTAKPLSISPDVTPPRQVAAAGADRTPQPLPQSKEEALLFTPSPPAAKSANPLDDLSEEPSELSEDAELRSARARPGTAAPGAAPATEAVASSSAFVAAAAGIHTTSATTITSTTITSTTITAAAAAPPASGTATRPSSASANPLSALLGGRDKDDEEEELSDDAGQKKAPVPVVAPVAAASIAAAVGANAQSDDLEELSDEYDMKARATATATTTTTIAPAVPAVPSVTASVSTPAVAAAAPPAVPATENAGNDFSMELSDDYVIKPRPTTTTTMPPVVPAASSASPVVVPATTTVTSAPVPPPATRAVSFISPVAADELSQDDPLGGLGDTASSASAGESAPDIVVAQAKKPETKQPEQQPHQQQQQPVPATTTANKKKTTVTDDDDISTMDEEELTTTSESSSSVPAAALAARAPSMRRSRSQVMQAAPAAAATDGPRRYAAGLDTSGGIGADAVSVGSDDVFNIADDIAISADLQRFALTRISVGHVMRTHKARYRRYGKVLRGSFTAFLTRRLVIAHRTKFLERRLVLQVEEMKSRAPLAALLLFEFSEFVGRDYLTSKWLNELEKEIRPPFLATRSMLETRQQSRGGTESREATYRQFVEEQEALYRLSELDLDFHWKRSRIEEKTRFDLLAQHFAVENGEFCERRQTIEKDASSSAFVLRRDVLFSGRETISRRAIHQQQHTAFREIYTAHTSSVARAELSAVTLREIARFEKEEGFRRRDVESSYDNHMSLYTKLEKHAVREEVMARAPIAADAHFAIERSGGVFRLHVGETAGRQLEIEAKQAVVFEEMLGRYRVQGEATSVLRGVRGRSGIEIAASNARQEASDEERHLRKTFSESMRRSLPLFRDWGSSVSFAASLPAYRKESDGASSSKSDARMHARNHRHVCELIVAMSQEQEQEQQLRLQQLNTNPNLAFHPRPPTVPATLPGGVRTSGAVRSILSEVPAAAALHFLEAKVNPDLDVASKHAVDRQYQLHKKAVAATPADLGRVFPHRLTAGRRKIEVEMFTRSLYLQHATTARAEMSSFTKFCQDLAQRRKTELAALSATGGGKSATAAKTPQRAAGGGGATVTASVAPKAAATSPPPAAATAMATSSAATATAAAADTKKVSEDSFSLLASTEDEKSAAASSRSKLKENVEDDLLAELDEL